MQYDPKETSNYGNMHGKHGIIWKNVEQMWRVPTCSMFVQMLSILFHMFHAFFVFLLLKACFNVFHIVLLFSIFGGYLRIILNPYLSTSKNSVADWCLIRISCPVNTPYRTTEQYAPLEAEQWSEVPFFAETLQALQISKLTTDES